MANVKIGIIEDSEIHGEWLKAEIENDPNFELVCFDRTARAGIQSVKQNLPDGKKGSSPDIGQLSTLRVLAELPILIVYSILCILDDEQKSLK